MELELVFGTIRKGIKSTTYVHVSKCIYWYSISAFRKKLKIISYIQWFLRNFSPQNS